jgi:N-acetylneuraminic acid mutarotase
MEVLIESSYAQEVYKRQGRQLRFLIIFGITYILIVFAIICMSVITFSNIIPTTPFPTILNTPTISKTPTISNTLNISNTPTIQTSPFPTISKTPTISNTLNISNTPTIQTSPFPTISNTPTIQTTPLPPMWILSQPMSSARTGIGITNYNNIIYTFGGPGTNDLERSNIIEIYDINKQYWKTLNNIMPIARFEFGTAIIGDNIYLVGGIGNNNIILNDHYSYNIFNNTWKQLTPIPTARKQLASVVLDDNTICSFGGQDANKINLATVECYNIINNSWNKFVPSMPSARATLAAVKLNNYIYIFGGHGNTVDALDIITNIWIEPNIISNMPQSINYASGVSIKGKLYSIGGYLNVVFVYDPVLNIWSKDSYLNVARWEIASTVIGNTIYAVGGDSDNFNKQWNTMEKIEKI